MRSIVPRYPPDPPDKNLQTNVTPIISSLPLFSVHPSSPPQFMLTLVQTTKSEPQTENTEIYKSLSVFSLCREKMSVVFFLVMRFRHRHTNQLLLILIYNCDINQFPRISNQQSAISACDLLLSRSTHKTVIVCFPLQPLSQNTQSTGQVTVKHWKYKILKVCLL